MSAVFKATIFAPFRLKFRWAKTLMQEKYIKISKEDFCTYFCTNFRIYRYINMNFPIFQEKGK